MEQRTIPKIVYVPTVSYKLIYVFCVHDAAHEGLLKVGDASLPTLAAPDTLLPNCSALNAAARARINSYTITAGVSYHLLYTELAIRRETRDDGSTETVAFRDGSVHAVLSNSGIAKVYPNEVNANEWFRTDLATVLNAIKAVKQGRRTLYASEITPADAVEILLRQEQEDAIQKTIERFRRGDSMLWNAKMRYGKTVTALSLVKRQLDKYQKTIIVTHRPVVQSGWQEDFYKVFRNSDCVFAAKDHDSDNPEESSRIDSANELQLKSLVTGGKPFIYFASIQDLRGSKQVGGSFNKNNAIFKMHWDLVINDEAHEGTQTDLGKRVTTELTSKDTKVLSLSGTPFNILYQYDDDSIYTWDYCMEQAMKLEWDKTHPGDPNPYASLPQMHIFTYELGDIIRGLSPELAGKAFTFTEFFRTWSGDPQKDGEDVPHGKHIGDFVREADIVKFLNLITTKSDESDYPFATEEHRRFFQHTLWMIPGVKEAKALSKLLREHPIFRNFGIANVAGEGDDFEDQHYTDALALVKKTIRDNDYSITLSCGKLTTGVTIKEWTACMMLSGSYFTAASTYLQTIFRVQSPGSIDGKAKEHCYVFDFAPDRTLRVLAEAANVARKGGTGGTKTDDAHRAAMRKFLNFCPVLAISGTSMKPYSVDTMMQQIKRIYAEKAIRSGFDDASIYNDRLFTLDKEAEELLAALKAQIGATKAIDSGNEVKVSHNGLTEEEYEQQKEIQKKPKRERTPEELAQLAQHKEQLKQRNNAISILRGVSVRMPLLIFGADVPFDEDITIERFVDMVDDSSWTEFMPRGVTKDVFRKLIPFYDGDVFLAAGKEIREQAKRADGLLPTERVQTIAQLFSYFKNPDKETVLTPWRVVNLHMSDTLGGYDFFDEAHEQSLDTPRLVDRGAVSFETLLNPDAKILEINSKTGLYPLYVSYSIYRAKCEAFLHPAQAEQAREKRELTIKKQQQLWEATVRECVFVICKTKMAKTITQRTLLGYKAARINAHSFDDLVNQLKNKPDQFIGKVKRASFWNVQGETEMKFDAVVGNPPYQIMDGGNKASATPVYNYFVEQAKCLTPKYISMIMPAKWYSGGKGLDGFRDDMLNDVRIQKLVDFEDSNFVFTGIDIAGGVCFFLWDKKYNGKCTIYNRSKNGIEHVEMRYLNAFDTFIRNNNAIEIVHKVTGGTDHFMSELVSARKPFGLPTNTSSITNGDLSLRYNAGMGKYARSQVTAGQGIIDKWKVIISYLSSEHAGQPDKNGMFKVLSTLEILPPKAICTETYLVVDSFESRSEAQNLMDYLKARFVRFLVLQIALSQHITRNSFKFVPIQDFTKSWTDEELYAKYGLTKEEIAFVEATIKPME